MSELADLCRGKWRAIHAAIGIAPEFLNPRKNGPCPKCGGKDRWRWTDYDGRGCWVCNSCGRGDGVDLVEMFLGCDFREAETRIREILTIPIQPVKQDRDEKACRKAMGELWNRGRCLTPAGVAGRYLRSRGIEFSVFPACLREIDGMMLAQIIGPDGCAVNIQRTMFDHAGRKMGRKMMPGSCPLGSTVRLAPPAAEMGISEGVETALSASILFGIPVWAALSADGMKAFRPPEIIEKLRIISDNDANFVGQAAAYGLARSLARSIEIEVHLPDGAGQDWNDVLMAGVERRAPQLVSAGLP